MFEEVRKNKIKSVFLIFLFLIIIGGLGSVLGLIYGSFLFGLIFALILGTIYSLIAYSNGDKIILKLSSAKEVTKKEQPYLFHTVEGLAIAAGIPTPKIYMIEDTAINAFATGKDPKKSSITVTSGLVNSMNREELEGVVAHEMSHIKNYDIRFMMLTAVLLGLVTLLSDFILRSFLFGAGRKSRDSKGNTILIVVGLILAILAPLIGQLIRLAVSRKREYLADANAVILTRYPSGLANALKKIAKDPNPLVEKANKATAHLFISSPFKKKSGLMFKLFSTHPPIEDRIKRLEEM